MMLRTFKIILFAIIILLCEDLFSERLQPNLKQYYYENNGFYDSTSLIWFQSGYNLIRFNKNGYIITSTEENKLKVFNEQIHHSKFEDQSININYENINVNYLYSNSNSLFRIKNFNGSYLNLLSNHLNLKAIEEFEFINIYENIDVIYSIFNNLNKIDWKIRKNGKVSDIKIEYLSSNVPLLDSNGNLIVRTKYSYFKEYKPYAYQFLNGKKIEIPVKYILNNNILSFEVGKYDRNFELIIDPILVFSTYSGSLGDNFGYCATYDNDGNLYTAGIVNAMQGSYPVTNGSFQISYGGCGSPNCVFPFDISISKYSKDGKTLLFASYLGGNRYEYPHSINVNIKNELIVFGTTGSTNFPTTTNAVQKSYSGGGNDLFVSRISEDGTKLLASTYLGGSNIDGTNDGELVIFHNDYYRGEIIDLNDRIIIGTSTKSNDIPTTKGAIQPQHGGDYDGYFAILNQNLDSLIYGTYYGGSGNDAILNLKYNHKNGLIYLNGASNSPNLLMSGNGAINSNTSGETDGFISAVDLVKSKIIYSTFSGLNFTDQYYFLDFDTNGDVFATGISYDFITKSSSCWGKDFNSQFIVKFSENLSKQLLISTFGSYSYPTPHLSPTAFMIDRCDNIYLSAWGSGMESGFGYNEGTTMDLDYTIDAFQSTTDSNDFYLFVLTKDMTSLEYATFIGGNKSADHIDGGMSRFDKNGIIYQSVCASCPDSGFSISDFPVDRDALYNFNTSPRCNNASLKFYANKSNYSDAAFSYLPEKGCAPLVVNLIPNQRNTKHQWDFGNGYISTDSFPSTIYTKAGKYKIIHIVNNINSCNKTDTFFRTIEISKGIEYNLIYDKCSNNIIINALSDSLEFNFENSITYSNSVQYTMKDSGIFKFRIVNPNSVCKDTIYESIHILYQSNEIPIENVFTPNNDGVNDCYTAGNLGSDCDKSEFIVYDRWGVELFNSNEDGPCWNGTYKNTGLNAPDGTYFVLIFKEENHKTIPLIVKLMR